MKILITGSNGFIGKNLVCRMREKGYTDLYLYDMDTPETLLCEYTKNCEFVFHLAGVNRPENPADFMKGNLGITTALLENLIQNHNNAPVVITSSVQAALNNPYGESKKAGEDFLTAYGKTHNIPVCIYRLPNVFGKWCRPNYNSAIATFCYNITRGLPITINNRETELQLVYIDDVVDNFISLLSQKLESDKLFYETDIVYRKKLGNIVDLIYSFQKIPISITVPNMSDSFIKKLYSTYLSFLPVDKFAYFLTTHTDERGAFAELFRSESSGQVSVNISMPGVVKGNHWHHTKVEKFAVVKGIARINFRHIQTGETAQYTVGGADFQIVDIPPGYTHNIDNIGSEELITIIWANECFDSENADTYFLEV